MFATEGLTIPMGYVITVVVFALSVFAGFVGWLASVSITLGKLAAKTEVRVENLERIQGNNALTIAALDNRLDDHEKRISLVENAG